jgi:transposase
MSKRRLVITAVLCGQSQSEVARSYGVSQGWVSRLMARYRVEGEAAFEPLSRAPKTSPGTTPVETVELVLRLRKQLDESGLDAGADTIGWHLAHHHGTTLSRATINRILIRAGTVTPDPSKRPKSSYVRFEADQPNECWQADFTHYRLSDGTDVEILTDQTVIEQRHRGPPTPRNSRAGRPREMSREIARISSATGPSLRDH